MEEPKGRARALLVPALFALVILLGVGLRLADPLSSPAMGAEDPYTHVVFTKEHMRLGYFDDVFVLGTSLYPPGMHALSGIYAPLAGIDLYQWARFSPALFGALSILGMGLLATRLHGPGAGLAASLLTAVMPEHIRRTDLFFPTMVDMALLPAFFLLFLMACERNRGAALLTLFIAGVLSYSHPWVVPLAALAAATYAGLRLLRGAAFDTDADTSTGDFKELSKRLAFPAGLLSLTVAIAAVTRWDHGNTGFVSFLADAGPLAILADIRLPNLLLFPLLALLLGIAAAAAVALTAGLAVAKPRVPKPARYLGAWAIGLGLAILAVRMARVAPKHVGYEFMLGSVPVALALLGLVIAFVRPTRLGDLALSMSVVLFPLTAIQFFDTVFDAEFWPSRAVVYLALGVALLGATSVQWAADEIVRMASKRRTMRWVAPTAPLVALMLLGTALAAAPAPAKGWYRLYTDEEFHAFEDAAQLLDSDPKARIVVPGWQSGLILKTLADPAQVRYGPKFFNETSQREKIITEDPDDHLYVLVDHFLLEKAGDRYDLAYLDGPEYTVVHRTSDDNYRLYQYQG